MTRILVHFTSVILGSQFNVPNKAGDTPTNVASRYQHSQLVLFYETWDQSETPSDIIVQPGN